MAEANRQALRLLASQDPRQRAPRWWMPRVILPPEIAPVHMFLGIVCGPRGVGYHAITGCGVDPEKLSDDVVARLPRAQPLPLAAEALLPLSGASSRVVHAAVEEAYRLSHSWVGTEHLLLALCAEGNGGLLRRTMKRHQIRADRVRAFVVANIASLAPSSVPAFTPPA